MQATTLLVGFLQRQKDRIAQVPLQTSPQRFGNKAFRDWLAGVEQVRRPPRNAKDGPEES